ncbi:MAG: S8 family serine peptidase [Gammaproteobacteria bacterium]
MRRNAVTPNSLSLARGVVAALLAAMALMTVASAAERNPARARPSTTREQPAAQRIIVKFRQSSALSIQASKSGESAVADTAQADSARMSALATRARITLHGSKLLGGNMHLMQVSPLSGNESAAETLARLRADSQVEFAEIDRRVYLHATDPNDPHYLLNSASDSGQWYLREAQKSAINARGAWDTTTGSNGVVIAVVDTGVLYNHEDLMTAGAVGGKLLPGYDFVSPDSSNTFTTAGDGTGRDSDPTDPGDFCTSEGDTSSWHGTRVSGIIGALTNNNIGVAGINWKGYILPVRVIGRCGGFNSDVIAGMYWAAGLSASGAPTNPYPAQIINISLGGSGACDSASQQAVSDVTAAGALVVVSAGNEGGSVDSPANCIGAMGILGLRQAGTKVGFSSLGPQIALGAPGGNCVNTDGVAPCVYSIDTTTNTGTTTAGANTYTDKQYADANVGTSFSSPIVSGIAGLMLSVNGNLKSKQLIARLKEGASAYPTTSDNAGVPSCQDPSTAGIQPAECICNTAVCGAGMANAYGAVQAALRPIAAIAAPSSYSAGSSVPLSASGSAGACNLSASGGTTPHAIASYSWAVGGSVISSTATAQVTAPTTGTTAVQLTVTDDAGKIDVATINVGPTSAQSVAPASAGGVACLNDIVLPGAASPSVTLTASDANAAEASADPGVFTVSRSGSTATALTVNLAYAGTATNGTDYATLPATVIVPAGSASATITVTPVDDSAVEGSETVIATLQTGTGYEVGSPSSATVTIADNDTTPAPPPSSGGGGGKSGGGAFDPLTLLGALGFTVFAAFRRLRAARGTCQLPSG